VFVFVLKFTIWKILDSRNYNQEGYGEFGFQITLSQRPERIIITAPGSFYFRGNLVQKCSFVLFCSRLKSFRWSAFTSYTWTQLDRYATSVYDATLSVAWSELASLSIELFVEWIRWLVLSRYLQIEFSSYEKMMLIFFEFKAMQLL